MWMTALILGFAGSMHCLGMCSPLVMAVTSTTRGALLNRVVYNTGRILTYACIGAVVASAGLVFPLHKFQNIISILLGMLLLLVGVGCLKNIKIPALTSLAVKVSIFLKNRFAYYLRQKQISAVFMLGVLNGLLPCGLTLLALTSCLSLRGPFDGFNFMLLFGVGTLPAMLGLTAVLPGLVKKFKWNLPKLTTAMLIFSGCLLIVRVFLVHNSHAAAGDIVDIIMCR